MDKKYVLLFTELARSLEVLAERALEEEKQTDNEAKINAAMTMRDKYAEIYDKMHNNENAKLSIADFAHLYVAGGVLVNQLESKKNELDVAITGYKIDLLPKLNRILNETHNDIEAVKLAEEIFTIKETENK